MKILIVDDSKSIRKLVQGMLSDLGHESVMAENGRVALDKIKSGQQYSLILLDWNMPEMSGDEFLQSIMEDEISTGPIVMMTTENSPEKIKRALGLGAKEYLMKPFSQDILKDKIESLVAV